LTPATGGVFVDFSALSAITWNAAKTVIRPGVEILGLLVDDESDEENGGRGLEAIDNGLGPEQLIAEQQVRQRPLAWLLQIPRTDQEVFWLWLRGGPLQGDR
jgi:hypothetical protein